jgi:transcription elongation factor GreA
MAEDKFPMTPAGLEALRAEVKRIKEVERPANVKDIETALDHGDLRENAEYHAAKEKQAELDGRLRNCEYRIGRAEVIDPATVASDRVAFGATVRVLDLETDTQTVYSIVGEHESDVDAGKISILSPIARAMLGKTEGDDFTLKLPKGERELEIVSIEYKAID